jgi:hypothetical protein
MKEIACVGIDLGGAADFTQEDNMDAYHQTTTGTITFVMEAIAGWNVLIDGAQPLPILREQWGGEAPRVGDQVRYLRPLPEFVEVVKRGD